MKKYIYIYICIFRPQRKPASSTNLCSLKKKKKTPFSPLFSEIVLLCVQKQVGFRSQLFFIHCIHFLRSKKFELSVQGTYIVFQSFNLQLILGTSHAHPIIQIVFILSELDKSMWFFYYQSRGFFLYKNRGNRKSQLLWGISSLTTRILVDCFIIVRGFFNQSRIFVRVRIL